MPGKTESFIIYTVYQYPEFWSAADNPSLALNSE